MNSFRFGWIFFCFLLSFWRGLPIAALLTLCADFFLLFPENYAFGLSFFLLAQTAYLCHLRRRSFSPLWLLALFFLPLFPVVHLGGCYAVLFACHFFLAIKKASSKGYLLGLILFICCDVIVAWGYFHTPAPTLIWLFYAPSQLLLALTAKNALTPIP